MSLKTDMQKSYPGTTTLRGETFKRLLGHEQSSLINGKDSKTGHIRKLCLWGVCGQSASSSNMDPSCLDPELPSPQKYEKQISSNYKLSSQWYFM